MPVSLTYTVADVISMAMSKIGVVYAETEARNIEDAQRYLNVMIGGWSADPDLAIARIVPLSGYANLTDTIDAPPEFITAMVLNLAVSLTPDYDQKPDKVMLGLAGDALEKIKIFNVRRISGRIPTNGLLG